jgi:hypothetical protein
MAMTMPVKVRQSDGVFTSKRTKTIWAMSASLLTGKVSLKDNNKGKEENAHPNINAPLYVDVQVDMQKRMQALACNNLTWAPTMCYDTCRKEMDANFPQGWSGLQKHQACKLVRKARQAQGLRNTVLIVENTPAYREMKDTKCPLSSVQWNLAPS